MADTHGGPWTPAGGTPAQAALLRALRAIVGDRDVVTGQSARRYSTGYRTGAGACLAAVRPGSLIEMWRVLKACVEANAVVIVQAANTGLTGGSTPAERYDRDVVIVSTLRIKGVSVVKDGAQVVCLAGATLYELERALKPYGREPHSVIGSSCIGASVIGGVCNNSGGALVRRGPAFTELALYARLNESGALELINHLGADLGEDAETILATLERGDLDLDALLRDTNARACDETYAAYVRDVQAATPARFNADRRNLYEASGSAGKLAVFAVRLDTFAPEPATLTYYIGTNDPDDLTRLRRILLESPLPLPIAAEYIHREAFDIADRYGRDTFLAIRLFGVDRLPLLYRFKAMLDALAPRALGDRVLQFLADFVPAHLPKRLRQFRDRYEHHLILKVGADARDGVARLLQDCIPKGSGDFFTCSAKEADSAFLHRFVTAGAAVRYRALHPRAVEDIVALDFALPRNELVWAERLAPSLQSQLVAKLYYGHFFCHVFHHDYIVKKGTDMRALEEKLHALLDARGAEYPAEHNVGHLYRAKPALEQHYRELDPCNSFNPGVGKLPKGRGWTSTEKENAA